MQIGELSKAINQTVTVQGWLTNKRSSKGLFFLVVRDGSGFLQCVVDENNVSPEVFEHAKDLTQESAAAFTGTVLANERQEGGLELQVNDIKVYQIAEEYPISNKPHGVEFLMDNRHLWLRSRRQWAIMRIRNRIIYAIHNFFQKEGFVQMDAPIFTTNACEGTSTLFEVNYYDNPAYLSQSGQLYGEAMAMAMGKIYTFGPTFRAEKSKTRRHLSEFWMIEPEMAFFDNDMNMDLIEEFIRSIVKEVHENCANEFSVLERDTAIFESIISNRFPRLSYDEAVKILRGEQEVNGRRTIGTLEADLKQAQDEIVSLQAEIDADEATMKAGVKKGLRNHLQNKIDTAKNKIKDLETQCENIPGWINSARNFEYGNDFGGSDETALTRLFDVPIMVYNWPHEIKAFYMKRDAKNPQLAKGVDVLAPEGYGEVVGGGERETNKEWLIEKINEHGLPMEAFEWYLDLRRYGAVPHAGFGLGLERIVAWICKLQHIRETIPFPRMYGRSEP